MSIWEALLAVQEQQIHAWAAATAFQYGIDLSG